MISSGGKKFISTLLKKLMPIYGFFFKIQISFLKIYLLSSSWVKITTHYSQALLIMAGLGLFSATYFQL